MLRPKTSTLVSASRNSPVASWAARSRNRSASIWARMPRTASVLAFRNAKTEAVRGILAQIEADLLRDRAAQLATGELRDALTNVDVFGLNMARLDLRQHSGPHARAIAELIARADYEQLDEARKQELLVEALKTAAPLPT